ncbi:hypothetical protein VUR80DRAFT_8012 [Thermomyces stellatus]
MAFDLWTHQFCLSCDKQTDGATYCSESCRLADYEKTCSSASSTNSSPGYSPPSTPLSAQQPSKFYLSPAYDFSTAQPYGRTPLPPSYLSQRAASASTASSHPGKPLTPSSSHSSLCSMQSVSSNGSEGFHLSEKSRKELQAYAVSFEQVRLHRRRSY